ncbi:Phosphopantetheine attachment site [Roseivivax lentus]|uniref:Phosphopantetheine attachment site n=1 Tax=Roseivivax lentus TaxID=633194 RepID=A0A1N7PXG3_9RHOB|nr:acyl carrier protein [Roseivivax lentus]SIT15304.1 Phosphopantetheine attachment site [Roseivivax lentus]
MAITIETAEAALRSIFEDLAEDLEADVVEFDRDTKLLDLGMESISLIYLISELQQHFELGDRLFQHLRESDRLLKDMDMGDILSGLVAVSAEEPSDA